MLFITSLGKKQRKTSWRHYAREMNQHLGDKLTEAETEKLAALLGKDRCLISARPLQAAKGRALLSAAKVLSRHGEIPALSNDTRRRGQLFGASN